MVSSKNTIRILKKHSIQKQLNTKLKFQAGIIFTDLFGHLKHES
jgi:hypothetical protein